MAAKKKLFQAMEAIDEILEDFDKDEVKQILVAVAKKYGIKSDGGGAMSPEMVARLKEQDRRKKEVFSYKSSLGTTVEVDQREADEAHDLALAGGGGGDLFE